MTHASLLEDSMVAPRQLASDSLNAENVSAAASSHLGSGRLTLTADELMSFGQASVRMLSQQVVGAAVGSTTVQIVEAAVGSTTATACGEVK